VKYTSQGLRANFLDLWWLISVILWAAYLLMHLSVFIFNLGISNCDFTYGELENLFKLFQLVEAFSIEPDFNYKLILFLFLTSESKGFECYDAFVCLFSISPV